MPHVTENNGDANSNNGPYQVSDRYHSQGSTIRVINVGAGAAGLLMAYKMKKNFNDYELVCYEKYGSLLRNGEVGSLLICPETHLLPARK